MRSRLSFASHVPLALFLCILLPSTAGADQRLTLAIPGQAAPVEVIRHETPGPAPVVTGPNGTAPAPRLASPVWTHLDMAFKAGRMRTVALANYGFEIDAGSDECGYWRNWSPYFATGDWQPHGDFLGGGAIHLTNRYAQELGYERVCAVRGRDSSLWYSDDFGATWSASTFNGTAYQVLSVKKMLCDGNFANVSYLLARVFNPDTNDEGWLLARSFDGGKTWDLIWYDSSLLNADLWTSRIPTSIQYIARDDGTDIQVDVSSDVLGSWSNDFTVPFYGGFPTGLSVTGDEADSGHVWVSAGDRLFEWDGATLNDRGDYQISDGQLAGAIFTPGYLMWADFYYVYVSSDYGVTATALPNSNWLFNSTDVNQVPLSVQCLAPLLIPASAGRERVNPTGPEWARGFGTPTERFYISTGSGVYTHIPTDGSTFEITDWSVQNHQIDDLAMLRGSNIYMMDCATRDLGKMEFRTNTTPLFWSGLVTTYPNDNASTVTNLLPVAHDPFMLSQFTFGLSLTGHGNFNGVGTPHSFPGWHQVVADPNVRGRWYWCDSNMWQVDFDEPSGIFTTTPVGPDYTWTDKLGYAVAPSDPLIRYASAVGFGFGPLILKSIDGGLNWAIVSISGPVGPDFDHPRTTILVSPNDPDDVYVLGSSAQHSTNGLNFVDISPVGQKVYDAVFEDASAAVVWAATDQGVIRWNGASWEGMTGPGSGVPDVPFHAIDADPYRGVVRAGSWGRGLFEYPIASVSGAPEPSRPTVLTLAPAGNPARGLTPIQFTLPAAGRITLELLDVSGRRVETLLDEEHAAGAGSVSLDTSRYPAGVYFARAVTAGGSRTTKIVIER